MLHLIVLLAGAAGSWALTGLARRYALARSVLDVPNHRSSHTVATPRGGGVAITVVVLAGVLLGIPLGLVDLRLGAALLGGGVLVAGVGWVDDHGGLGPGWRALAHVVAATWALLWLGGLSYLHLGVATVPLGPLGTPLSVVAVVWVTNLFNFMDGIDGLAAGEGVTVGGTGAVLLLLAGAPGLAFVALLVAVASAGFLCWNWQPAKIFMGDVGSYMLGYSLAVVALAAEGRGAVPLLVWLILGGVFVFDATATLLRRMARGERWYDAHRSHAYQRATQVGWSHGRVSGCVLLVNLLLAGLGWAGWAVGGWAIPAAALLAGSLLALLYLAVERARPMGGERRGRSRGGPYPSEGRWSP